MVKAIGLMLVLVMIANSLFVIKLSNEVTVIAQPGEEEVPIDHSFVYEVANNLSDWTEPLCVDS